MGTTATAHAEPRELEILRLWLRSESKTVAASDLGISLGTINTHLIRIRAKYAAAGRPLPTSPDC